MSIIWFTCLHVALNWKLWFKYAVIIIDDDPHFNIRCFKLIGTIFHIDRA